MQKTTISLLAFLCITCHVQAALGAESRIGKKVALFTLDNCYGRAVSLNDIANKKAIVVAFLGTECPLAKLYGPRLEQLQQRFGTDDVAIQSSSQNHISNA